MMSQRVPVHFAGTNGPLGPLISPSHRHLDSDSGMRPFLHTPSVAGDPKCRRTCTPAPPVRAGVQLKLQPLFFFFISAFSLHPVCPRQSQRERRGSSPLLLPHWSAERGLIIAASWMLPHRAACMRAIRLSIGLLLAHPLTGGMHRTPGARTHQ